MSRCEMELRGWSELDILFVSGDAYVDHPAFGVPLLARLLEAEGYRVGIIAQPDWKNPESLKGMGRPRLFAAVSSGAMDSMVNHYTALKKIRRDDAYTPGGVAGLRPNRAVIAYTAALKGAHKKLPVIIGGIEASLRRLAHFDYWDGKVRRSVLVDSKADLLVYGMGERALLEAARRMQGGAGLEALRDIPGTAHIGEPGASTIVLPSYEEVSTSQRMFLEAYRVSHCENPFASFTQRHGDRHVVVMSPAEPLTSAELDRLYRLPFKKLPHPSYTEPIPAYQQIRFSLTSHRGCCGGCSFCAIAAHQGREIQSRSIESICDEAQRLSSHPDFKGSLSDVGGATANMYGVHCANPEARRFCRRQSCLHPQRCKHLVVSPEQGAQLLQHLRREPGLKHVPVASGIRHDLLEVQQRYFDELVGHHVGGLLKIAPEILSTHAADVMAKPGPDKFEDFLEKFRVATRKTGRRYGVVPYLMAGHPGCTLDDVIDTALFLKKHRLRVEQVQIFTPTPATRSTCMWYTGVDPVSGSKVHVPDQREAALQKGVLLYHLPENRSLVEEAFRRARRDLAKSGLLAAAGRR